MRHRRNQYGNIFFQFYDLKQHTKRIQNINKRRINMNFTKSTHPDGCHGDLKSILEEN